MKVWMITTTMMTAIGALFLCKDTPEVADTDYTPSDQPIHLQDTHIPTDLAFFEEPPLSKDEDAEAGRTEKNGGDSSESFSLDEALKIEKLAIYEIPEISQTVVLTDRYKLLLLENLQADEWIEEDLELVKHFLADARAQFQPGILEINTTHQETEVQYAHQLATAQVVRCMEFLDAKGDEVKSSSEKYGVPAEIIVSILKVESNFGSYPGKEYIFNVFWSLSLGDHPGVLDEMHAVKGMDQKEQAQRLRRRARWGRSELLEIIHQVKGGAGDWIMWIKGSWAGAFGLPQFIPSSYSAYGRDGNDDGIVDLNNISDASASIAYYLKANGWKGKIGRDRQKKVIMRYNHSSHYADCILALADSIHQRLDKR